MQPLFGHDDDDDADADGLSSPICIHTHDDDSQGSSTGPSPTFIVLPGSNVPIRNEDETGNLGDTIQSKSVVSYQPLNAGDPTIPPLRFGCSENMKARAMARTSKLAIFAVQVAKEGAMNYVVGPWQSASDMVIRDSLRDRNGRLLFSTHPGNTSDRSMGAVYECIFGDQSSVPYFDIEFYSDMVHGNPDKCGDDHLDEMTRSIARMASALLEELFPHAVALPAGKKRQPLSPSAAADALDAARVARRKYYVNPLRSSKGDDKKRPMDPLPYVLDPERHWLVLDASRGHKRSRHLVLSKEAGVYFDTARDQAIFVGLLLRRIYQSAFAIDNMPKPKIFDDDVAQTNNQPPSRKGKEKVDADDDDNKEAWTRDIAFRSAAQQLFVTDLRGPKADKRRKYTTGIDDCPYKDFQLFRTCGSSKLGQGRPLKLRPETFGDPPAIACHSDAAILQATLVGRIPRDARPLSFAQCYPRLFGKDIITGGVSSVPEPVPRGRFVSSMHKDARPWGWVPTYVAGGTSGPPVLSEYYAKRDGGANARYIPATQPTGVNGRLDPWEVPESRAAVRDWLWSTVPSHDLHEGRIVHLQSELKGLYRTTRGGGGSSWTEIQRRTATLPSASPADVSTDVGCVLDYMRKRAEVRPWLVENGNRIELKFRESSRDVRDPRTGAVHKVPIMEVMVPSKCKICPISERVHRNGRPFMVIDYDTGTVRVQCISANCRNPRTGKKFITLPPITPDRLAVIFKSVEIRILQAQEAAEKRRREAQTAGQKRKRPTAMAPVKKEEGGAQQKHKKPKPDT